MLGVTFGNKHSYNDWGIWLEDTHINPPLPKRYIVDVPARNGLLDLTAELTPTIRFENRTLTFTFRVKAGDWSSLLSTIYGQVHGQTLDVVSDLDPNWHWHGCVTVDDFSSDERTGVLVITVDADPFKLSNTENSYTVNGNGTITCVVDRMEISPAFEIEAPTTVIYGDSSYVISSSRTTEKTASGDMASFDDGTANPVVNLTANIEAVQIGSGTPSPSNIRPISGWSSVSIRANGKNLYKEGSARTVTVNGIDITIDADGGIHASGTNDSSQRFTNLAYTYGSKFLPVGVPLKLVVDVTTGIRCAVCYSLQDDVTYNAVSTNVAGVYSFTIPENAKSVWTRVYLPSSTTFVDTDVVHPMVVIADETIYTFETYKENVYNTSLDSTVYGGTLNVTTGVLTVTHGSKLISECNWTYDSTYTRMQSGSFSDIITDLSVRTVPLVCSAYQCIDDGRSVSSVPNNSIYGAGNNITVYIKDTAYTNANTFKTAMGNERIVYPLNTPQTYILSPKQVRTLLNKNNIWTAAGSVNVIYRAQDFEGLKFYIPELEMTEGSNTLTIQGTGTTKVTYTNGRL